MTDKPPPHPPRQARHPGKHAVKHHHQQDHHNKVMKRKAEPLLIARHYLKPHPKGKKS